MVLKVRRAPASHQDIIFHPVVLQGQSAGWDKESWNNLQDLALIPGISPGVSDRCSTGFHWLHLSCEDLGGSLEEPHDLLTSFTPAQLLFKHNDLCSLIPSQCVTLFLQLSGPPFIIWKPPVHPQ